MNEITEEFITELKEMSLEDRMTALLGLIDNKIDHEGIFEEWADLRDNFRKELTCLFEATCDEDNVILADDKDIIQDDTVKFAMKLYND